ncbi:Pr6Pr family membrane protein [Roseicyclus sp.]|uniref:Pr6Pr family membrane protein n=1 Tax=Roseicyclus sp. TaxID=1914329 RepID=UPI003F6BF3B5
MFMVLPRSARRMALAIAFLALASLCAQFIHLHRRADVPMAETAWDMARYFTILTNLLVVVTFAVISRPVRAGYAAAWLAALSLAAIMSGLIYHLVLAHLVTFTGLGWWADHGLHSLTPFAIAFWWLIHAPKQRLGYADLPIFVLWPSIYGAYALARGAADGTYPYPFIDLSVMAPIAVATYLVGLLVLFLLCGVLMILIGRFADR